MTDGAADVHTLRRQAATLKAELARAIADPQPAELTATGRRIAHLCHAARTVAQPTPAGLIRDLTDLITSLDVLEDRLREAHAPADLPPADGDAKE